MKKKLLAGLATGLFLIGMVDMVNAAPITYSFQGIGSGVLNSVSFTNTDISFELYADTDGVYSGGTDILKNNVNSSAINITGFSTASFTTADLKMFMNLDNNGLGFQDSIHFDLLDIQDGALSGYNLATDIGVIYEPEPLAYTQFNNVSTTLGPMSLNDVSWVNFSATVVPEPSSIAMIGLVSGFGFFVRRRFMI
jgi:hypothetical protein